MTAVTRETSGEPLAEAGGSPLAPGGAMLLLVILESSGVICILPREIDLLIPGWTLIAELMPEGAAGAEDHRAVYRMRSALVHAP